MEPIVKRIQWQETISLRHAVLWPDQTPEFSQVEGDETAWHFGVFLAIGLVSVVSVFPDGDTARIRKFATAREHQGKGLGTQLLTHIIAEVREQGIKVLWCDARESAIGFYERLGMSTEGVRFYKKDIPYFKMSIKLS